MPKLMMKTELAASPDLLWKTIGPFRAIGDWHPMIEAVESEGEGRGEIRTLRLAGGQGALVERLEHIDDSERVYSYSIVDSPLPLSSYTSQVRVVDNGDGTSTVEWSSEFTPSGADEVDVTKMLQDVYQAGLDNLAKLYGQKP